MHRRWWFPASIAALGLALLGSLSWHLFAFHAPDRSPFHVSAVALLLGGSGVGLLYGAYWHANTPLSPDRRLPVLVWTAGGALVLVSVGVISLHLGSRRVTRRELFESLHLSGSIGLLAGLLVGTIQAKAMESTEAAARASARAEALAAEQERLERLNDLLRHYILNGVNVISGYAVELRPAVPEAERDALDAIEESAETMATLVRHVRSIPDIGSGPSVRSVDVTAAIESAVEAVEPRSDLVIEARADLPRVRTSETFGQAFYLFLDALRTVTETGGTIEIDSESGDEAVVLVVTATPADLPRAIEESLFEPVASDVGLEFYLASTLLEHGDFRLVESDDALRFELHLEETPSDRPPGVGSGT